VVALNRVVAIDGAHAREAGLRTLDDFSMKPLLTNCNYFAGERAVFHSHLGRSQENRIARREALTWASNKFERAFLVERINDLRD
jgi:predicted RNA polymerase sigma factor